MPKSPTLHPLKWVYVAGGAFLITLIAGAAFVIAARRTTIPNAVYYVILFPLGLAAAAFLFGAMRSHAKYSGKISYGNLELGGPAVIFALVIAGGLLANKASTFSLVVRLHGPGGPGDVVRQGTLTADLAGDRRTRPIGGDGEVIFNGIPNELEGQPIRLIPDVAGLEPMNSEPIPIPANRIIELGLKARTFATTMRGTVTDSRDRTVAGAALSFDGGAVTTTSDANGNFTVILPLNPGTVISVTVTMNGSIVYDDNVTVAEQPPLRVRIRDPSRD